MKSDTLSFVKENAPGAAVVGQVTVTTLLVVALATSDSLGAWLLAQCLLAILWMQWFIVLHEAGHGTLFTSSTLNNVVGHVAGAMSLVPFYSWRAIHREHHVWTGWQDRDPTTDQLAVKDRSPRMLALLDNMWACGVPVVGLFYRINNFWQPRRLRRLFPRGHVAMRHNMMALLAVYGLAVAVFGAWSIVATFGLGLLLHLMLFEPFMLSQHTHVPQRIAGTRRVTPFTPADQVQFTRSLAFPPWVSRWVWFHFDRHEAHHAHPTIPGYCLGLITTFEPNAMPWWRWLRAAKRMPARVFLFQNRFQSGRFI